MKIAILALCLSIGMMRAVNWGYDANNGPAMWAKLDVKFALCGNGRHQSPINIESKKTIESKHELYLLYGTNAQDIINQGHTVQIRFNEAGGLVFHNKIYKLMQLYFHTPSEMQINGKIYPMEMQMIHVDTQNHYLVLVVLFEKGQNNAMLNNILSHIPINTNKVYPMDMLYISQMLPKKHDYYAFSGSFTTPPCTEGVQWIVLKESVEASRAQIGAMHAILQDGTRDVQPVNDRVILSAP